MSSSSPSDSPTDRTGNEFVYIEGETIATIPEVDKLEAEVAELEDEVDKWRRRSAIFSVVSFVFGLLISVGLSFVI